jgi:hypothetical protein
MFFLWWYKIKLFKFLLSKKSIFQTLNVKKEVNDDLKGIIILYLPVNVDFTFSFIEFI